MSRGSTHWPERWLDALLECRELRTKIRRGRVLAKRRRVKHMSVNPGMVSATVEDDSGGEESVRLRLGRFDDDVWTDVAERLTSDPGHAARLVTGYIDDDMMEAFDASGAELFPYDIADVNYYCTCDDTDLLCVHAVALHVALGEAIGADPFVLLELRGRDRGWLVEAAAMDAQADPGDDSNRETDAGDPLESLLDGYWKAGTVPRLAFQRWTSAPADTEALPVVRALGPGPLDTSPDDIAQVLSPLVRVARQRLDGWMDQVTPAMDDAPEASQTRSLEEILMEVAHEQGHITSAGVADALGVPVREARRHLQWLVDEGRLRVTGRTRGTRYIPTDGGVSLEGEG